MVLPDPVRLLLWRGATDVLALLQQGPVLGPLQERTALCVLAKNNIPTPLSAAAVQHREKRDAFRQFFVSRKRAQRYVDN